MSKKKIYQSYKLDSTIFDGYTIEEIIESLKTIKEQKSIPDDAKLDVSYYEYYAVFELEWFREETNNEYSMRVEKESAAKRAKEMEELDTYLKLKAKFENGS